MRKPSRVYNILELQMKPTGKKGDTGFQPVDCKRQASKMPVSPLELPLDWRLGRLSDLCSLESDQCDPSKTDEKVYLGLEHLDPGVFTVSRFGHPRDVVSSKNRFKRGDILYGKLRPYLDKAVLVDSGGICSTDILVLRPHRNVCALFVLGLIHSKAFTDYAVQTTNGLNHPRTSWTALKEFGSPIPPLPEQQKIAAILWKVQKAVEVEGALVRNSRDLKQSLSRHLFARGLHRKPLKETEIGPLPESWSVRKCDSICKMITVGIVVRPASHYLPSGVPAFRSLNIHEDRLDTSNLVFISPEVNDRLLSKSKLRTGDVLVVRTGYPGTSCVVPKEFNGANCIDLVILRADENIIRSNFLSRFFNSEHGRAQVLISRTGLAQQHLNVGAVKRMSIPIPLIDEQEEIDGILQSVDAKIVAHEAKQRSLQDLFKTLLHRLMTAQTRVQDLDIDVSEVRTS